MERADFFREKRVLVTGASGFIGGQLCLRLKALNAEIFAVSTTQQAPKKEIDQWIRGDLVDPDFVSSTVKSVQPDIIFHLAGFVTGQRELRAVYPTYQNILTATVNILIAATETGIQRLVLAGSLEEPDETEKEENIPVSPYAAAKWSVSVYARMFYKLYETPVTIPRIFMVYGSGKQNTDKLIPYVIRSLLLNKEPKLSSGLRKIDWIFIDDVVNGLLRMAYIKGINGKTIDLGTGKFYSIRDVCTRIQNKIESRLKIKYGDLDDRSFERIRKADLEKTVKFLDWEPEVQIDEGLDKTIEWFKTRISNGVNF